MVQRQKDSPQLSFLQGIWAAVPTPFQADGRLDIAGAERNARHFAHTLKLDGVFCNGLMGEGWALSFDERKLLLQTLIAASGPECRVGVVTTHHGLAETIELSSHAAMVGADHIVLFRPNGLFSTDEIYDYVCTISDAVADIPIVLFDSQRQNGGYPRQVIRRLAQDCRIVGVKCTRNADAIVSLRAECGDSVLITDPYESHWFGNLVRFDLQALYADPEPYLFQTAESQLIREYFSAHQNGQARQATQAYRRLEPLRKTYERWIVEPLTKGEPMNAALKHWCARMGLAAGPVRAPLRPLLRDEISALDRDLDKAFELVFGAPVDSGSSMR